MTPCRTASAQHRYGRRHIGITGASTHKFEPAQMGTEATSLRHARDRWSRSAWEMTDAFSSMEYPHWLIVAGAVLLVLGFIGHLAKERTLRPSSKKLRMGMSKSGPTWPNSLRHRPPIGRRSLRSRRGRDGLIKTVIPKRNR